jgi:hypothetical protein
LFWWCSIFFWKKTKDETTYPRLGMMGMDFKWW